MVFHTLPDWIFQSKDQIYMENIWRFGQRSALKWCFPSPAVQTEKSLDPDAWLSQREGTQVSADINPPPSTFTPTMFRLPRLGLKEGPLGEEAGASSGGRAGWKSHHTVTFELEWIWYGCDFPHVYSCVTQLWCSKTCQKKQQTGHILILQLRGLNKTLPRLHV